ncbi:hypothetical protein ACWF94_33905 [Streptomyces sp. NPDC055078]
MSDGGDDRLDALLGDAYQRLGIAVYDSLMSQGGPPEPVDPERALGRLLAAAHRQTKTAVVRRTAQLRKEAFARDHDGGPAGSARNGSALMSRPAAVRLKYREQALRMARAYWPRELDEVIHGALAAIEELIVQLDAESLAVRADGTLARVSEDIGRVLTLPQAPQLPPALTGYGFSEAVQERLSAHADRLVAAVRDARTLLDLELIPHLADEDVSWPGALEVAQDLADDLDLAHREAVSLLGAVTSVREAGTDFRGADLHAVDLRGVRLEGIRWDAATIWPPAWEQRIRRASLAADDGLGVLVVRTEPRDSTVAADL